VELILAEVFEKIVSTIYKKETCNDVEFLSFKKLFGSKTFWVLGIERRLQNHTHFLGRGKVIIKTIKNGQFVPYEE
jgi:hypothetical protein